MRKSSMLAFLASVLLIIICSCFNAPVCFAQDGANIIAKGHGLITFTGDGPVSVNGEGSLVVNSTSTVSLFKNDGTPIPLEEVEFYARKNAGFVYINFNGKAQIEGEDLEVSFSGANIGLRVNRNGIVTLKGYGIYIDTRTGVVGHWPSEGIIISVNP